MSDEQETKPTTETKAEETTTAEVKKEEEPAEEEEVRLPSEIRAYYDAIERTLPR